MPRPLRLAALAACLCLALGPLPAAAASAPATFTDVPPGFWAAPAIAQLAGEGILSGVAPGHFAPEAPITRAELAALLLRIRGDGGAAAGPAFSDVRSGDWFYNAVEAVAGRGWMRGVGSGLFAPAAPVTRAAAAVAATAALGLGEVARDEETLPCTFRDCRTIPAWALGPVHVAADLGLLRGTSGGDFAPQSTLDRAEAAVLLARLQGVGPAALAAEGSRVAATVYVLPAVAALAAGSEGGVRAVAHDAAGYVVPAAFRFGVSGSGRLVSASGGAATVAAGPPGSLRVRASVVGGGPSAAVAIPVQQAATLAVAGLPPAGLAHRTLDFAVRVLAEGGGTDAAATGTVSLAVTARGGTTPVVRAAAAISGGQAEMPLPDLPPGGYSLALATPGLPPLHLGYAALARPEGTITLAGPAAPLPAGGTAAVTASLPGGPWPLQVTVVQRPGGAPAVPPATVVSASPAAAVNARGTAATLRAAQPGTALVTVAVPGGALRPATVRVAVSAAGDFAPAPAPAATTAGATVLLSERVSGAVVRGVTVTPIDPAGHPLPALPASVNAGLAQAPFSPHGAGLWRFVWTAPGLAAVGGAQLLVRPGPAAQLVVDPTPTSVLLPGQSAQLRAWLADAWGNPLPTPLRISRVGGDCGGGAPVGTVALGGPGVFGSFTASAPGLCHLSFRSPDHPGAGTATLSLRTVATAADILAGKGLWLTFPDWRTQPDTALLAQAAAEGATHLYLEVATSADGFYGGRALDDLLRQAHAAGLAVIAWVYPALTQPAADAATMRQVAHYITPTGDLADGLALDVEDHLDPATVATYARQARAALGTGAPLVGVTWAPQQKPNYPYRALAPYVTAFAPMDYWHVLPEGYSYAEVYSWVRSSVLQLRVDAGLPAVPVEVVAETFDWFAGGSGQGTFSPTAAELSGALAGAAAAGAVGVSFYRASTATPAERTVITQTPWPPAG